MTGAGEAKKKRHLEAEAGGEERESQERPKTCVTMTTDSLIGRTRVLAGLCSAQLGEGKWKAKTVSGLLEWR